MANDDDSQYEEKHSSLYDLCFYANCANVIAYMIISFGRCVFLDMMISYGFFACYLSDKLNKFTFKVLAIAMFVSIFLQIPWLYYYTTGWVDSRVWLDNFTCIMSYFYLVVKVICLFLYASMITSADDSDHKPFTAFNRT